MGKTNSSVLEFGPFKMDLVNRILMKGEEEITLSRKAFDLLEYFVNHPDRRLTKNELMSAVWPDDFRMESTLASLVHELRKTIGEDAIKTVHRSGYKFVSSFWESRERVTTPVQDELSDQPAPGNSVASRQARPDWIWVIAGGLPLILVAFFLGFMLGSRGQRPSGENSTARQQILSGSDAKAPSASEMIILSPQDEARLSGSTYFQVVLPNRPISTYKCSWQVDDGKLNPMQDVFEGVHRKEYKVDLTGWTWNTLGRYHVNFVAQDHDGVLIDQKDIYIYVLH